ncbi:SPOR domain-containing protein [Robbsia sp. Bb-Pol-6]|uniref:SPOR domain-containing protein n=1 Tax=Robbsia betulipollinis TaxID=2981849 RepID=A0ABT3ZS84_9BURK|nr:SPOR domain-containing protein [Robbsia betulipollinis]MCY0389070.1 SPOR domain-containing protein [Robbsia betulipollinis]
MASKQRRPSAPSNVRQSGGTFLGVVLGLIVGLAIAVVVALYITRSPTPFVSRSPAAASGDAASGNVDPNRPLAGAKPGIAVPQSAQPAPPNTAPGQPANPSTGLLDEPKIVEVPAPAAPSAPPAPAVSGDGDSAPPSPHWPNAPAKSNAPTPHASSSTSAASAAHPKPPGTASGATSGAPSGTSSGTNPSAAATGDANTGYLLQVGAYRTESDADQQRARLALMGYDAHVTRRDSGAVTFFRVRVGPFAKFDDMNGVRQHLSSAGVDTAVIRFTKQ